MDKIEKKLIYNLLSSIDILNYLDIRNKVQLSSCCKAIYYKCGEIRLQSLKISSLESQAHINNIQNRVYWTDNNHGLSIEYIDKIVNNYKNHLQSLIYDGLDYFIFEYYSLKFSNLTSLSLIRYTLPKPTLISIINNLPNLRSLHLKEITMAYSKVDAQPVDFKFSKYLRKLVWMGCRQVELDNTNHLSIKQYLRSPIHLNSNMLDIPLYLISTLKYLEWLSPPTNDLELFNKIIANNPELVSLTASLNSFNSDSFKLISNNYNLKKLSISLIQVPEMLNRSQLTKLNNIKTLVFNLNYGRHYHLMYLLVENCPNTEKLKLQYFAGCDDYYMQYIKYLKNLKVLHIFNVFSTPNILDSILPESKLEQLIIDSLYPLIINFNNLKNLNRLKVIKNNHAPNNNYNEYEVPNYDELKDWRKISHYQSTQHWKI